MSQLSTHLQLNNKEKVYLIFSFNLFILFLCISLSSLKKSYKNNLNRLKLQISGYSIGAQGAEHLSNGTQVLNSINHLELNLCDNDIDDESLFDYQLKNSIQEVDIKI